MRVIADHLRAATFLAVDGVKPSNKEQGYVMRRLLRRAIRFAFDLGIEQNFLEEVVPVIADMYHEDFPEVAANRKAIVAILVKEEKAFRQTLRKALTQASQCSSEQKKHGTREKSASFRIAGLGGGTSRPHQLQGHRHERDGDEPPQGPWGRTLAKS
jgi:alanyl-tRNA synthetase